MKTLNSRLSAAMILPAAVFLCQCAPTGNIPSLTVISFPVSTSDPAQVSSLLSFYDPPAFLETAKPAAVGKSESPRIVAGDWVADNPSGPQVIMLEPMFVTDSLSSLFLAGMRYWPANIVDAEEKKAWISFDSQDRSSRHPMAEFLDAWMASLR